MNLQVPISQMKEEGNWPIPWMSGIGLVEEIKKLGDSITGCEIGISYGFNLVYFLDELPSIKKVYAIDPYLPYDDGPGGFVTEEVIEKVKSLFLQNISAHRTKVEFLNKTATEAADLIPDNSLDYIFIDGDHSYDNALQDMKNYYKKVKNGGIFAGHDYYLPGVFGAVGDFRRDMKIVKPVLTCENSVWYWVKND